MATDKHHLQLTAPSVLTLHWVRTVFPLLRSRLVRRWRQWAVLNHGQRPALCQPLPRVLNTVSVRLRNTPSALQCQSMKGNILFRQICSKDKSKTEGMNERRRQKRHPIEISNKAGWGGANPTEAGNLGQNATNQVVSTAQAGTPSQFIPEKSAWTKGEQGAQCLVTKIERVG